MFEFQRLALELSDLEVALLLSLVAHEHVLVETHPDAVRDVAEELALICSNTFGFSHAILDCSASTTFDAFMAGILLSEGPDSRRTVGRQSSKSPLIEANASTLSLQSNAGSGNTSKQPVPGYPLEQKPTVEVVIAENFDRVKGDIQVQFIELMRSKRLVTENFIINAPKNFLFIPVVAHKSSDHRPSLNGHVIDQLMISHFHDPKDGYVYLEENDDWLSDGRKSPLRVPSKSEMSATQEDLARIDESLLEEYRRQYNSVTMAAEVTRYVQNIVVFLRLNRAVAGGISPRANSQFSKVSRLLAPLHGVDYVTPAMVNLAARKVFRHRIIVARAEDDRSLQYGSDIHSVAQLLAHATPDTILNDVIVQIDAPL